LALLKETPL